MVKIPHHYLICLAVCVLLYGCGQAEPDVVFKAYRHAVLNPETFDEYARRVVSSRSEEFFSCLSDIQESLTEAYRDAVEHCDRLPPEYQDKCRQIDIGAISGSLSAIAAVVRGETSWSATIYGMSVMTQKSLLPEFHRDTWQTALEVYKPALTCKRWYQFYK